MDDQGKYPKALAITRAMVSLKSTDGDIGESQGMSEREAVHSRVITPVQTRRVQKCDSLYILTDMASAIGRVMLTSPVAHTRTTTHHLVIRAAS